jgi:hypothetical protein
MSGASIASSTRESYHLAGAISTGCVRLSADPSP